MINNLNLGINHLLILVSQKQAQILDTSELLRARRQRQHRYDVDSKRTVNSIEVHAASDLYSVRKN